MEKLPAYRANICQIGRTRREEEKEQKEQKGQKEQKEQKEQEEKRRNEEKVEEALKESSSRADRIATRPQCPQIRPGTC